jgi:hypothetical protein
MKILPSVAEDGRTNTQADMTKMLVAFPNFSNAFYNNKSVLLTESVSLREVLGLFVTAVLCLREGYSVAVKTVPLLPLYSMVTSCLPLTTKSLKISTNNR